MPNSIYKERFDMSNKNSKQLCPNCKTGRDSYLLDNRSPFCPYIRFHNGSECVKFRPIGKQKENEENE